MKKSDSNVKSATGKKASRAAGGTTSEAPDAAIVAELAQRIKRMRSDAGLTLEQLAQRSGVSRAMLSKVERGEKSPTLAILALIAKGFKVSCSALLGAEPDLSDVMITRASKGLMFRDPETGFERTMISPMHLDNNVEIVLNRIPPGESSGVLPPYKQPTEKYLLVQDGQLTVYVEEERYVLETGDSMYFTVKAPYRFVNEAKHSCAFYMVIVRSR